MEEKHSLYIVGIVGIVAVVALVILTLGGNQNNTSTSEDPAGQAMVVADSVAGCFVYCDNTYVPQGGADASGIHQNSDCKNWCRGYYNRFLQ
jgi:hypothetical protein